MSKGVSKRPGREDLYGFVTGTPLDPEDGMYGGTRRVELIRRVVAEGFEEDLPGKLAEALYEVALGIADLGIAELLTQGKGGALVGIEAYADTGYQAVQSEAVLAATGDMLLEKLLHTSLLEAGTSFLKEMCRGGFVGAGTETLNTLADYLVAGRDSRIREAYRSYLEAGKTEVVCAAETQKILWGFLAGATLAGTANLLGRVLSKGKTGKTEIDKLETDKAVQVEEIEKAEGTGKIKSGSKSGSGSKFQEIFDLADNYTLSDDTFDNHILDRHGPNSTYGNKSHFNADFDIRDSIDSTLTGDNFIVGPNTAGREGYIFEQTFSNPIGTNSKGKPLYTLKVVIDEAGNVITAFPKK